KFQVRTCGITEALGDRNDLDLGRHLFRQRAVGRSAGALDQTGRNLGVAFDGDLHLSGGDILSSIRAVRGDDSVSDAAVRAVEQHGSARQGLALESYFPRNLAEARTAPGRGQDEQPTDK